jgi:hypothetical protein
MAALRHKNHLELIFRLVHDLAQNIYSPVLVSRREQDFAARQNNSCASRSEGANHGLGDTERLSARVEFSVYDCRREGDQGDKQWQEILVGCSCRLMALYDVMKKNILSLSLG